ncbi:hypothetical protein [Horticoccus sp. 23ND18S-11]|uniref:hypothetical protein n=1 Tax=Horticoccus sp. 23ND18S-11 TaxID=3391832 RepID=UPI0039C90D40
MKHPASLLLLALALFSGSALVAADSTPKAPSAAKKSDAKASLAGHYLGKWKGANDATGDLIIKLKKDGETPWAVESSFTFEGADIPTKSKSVEVDGTKLKMVFEWDIQGSAGQSTLVGELNGDTLKGTFETTGAAGESKGTWSAKRS